MQENDNSIGWGRSRPKLSELFPSPAPTERFDGVDVPDEDEGCDGMLFALHPRPRIMDDNMPSMDRVAPLIDYPLRGYDGAPYGELSQLYVNQGHNFKGLKKYYYALENGMKSPNTKFSSIFTCPVTGEHFLSGILPNHEGDFTVIGEIIWYKTKKLAVYAAAAKALDCFSLRRCYGTEKTHWQRCIDSPYLSAEEAPTLPVLPPGVFLPTPLSASQGELNELDDLVHPKQALIQYYISFTKSLEKLGICTKDQEIEMAPKSDWYSCWPNMKDSPNTLWTAIFTCHLTGERFQSGRLNGREGAYEHDSWYYDSSRCMIIPREIIEKVEDNHESTFDQVELIWYQTKKEAINAAAGRALDCLRHRDSRCANSSVNYCCESPYTVEDAPEIWKRVCQSALGVCGIIWPSIPLVDRLTTHFGVNDLHCLLENDDYWRDRYKEKRCAVDKDN